MQAFTVDRVVLKPVTMAAETRPSPATTADGANTQPSVPAHAEDRAYCRRTSAVTAVAIILPWALVALIAWTRGSSSLPDAPSPSSRRLLMLDSESQLQNSPRCSSSATQEQLLEALPHTPALLRALASYAVVDSAYFGDHGEDT